MSAADTVHDIDADFRRGLRVGLGWLCVGLLLAVAAIRFRFGQDAAAWIDVAWAVALVPALAMLHRRNSAAVGTYMAAVSVAGCCAKVHVLQMAGVPWLFPVLLGAFAVSVRWHAAVLASIGVLYSAWAVARFAEMETALAIGVSMVLTLLVAFLTTTHVEALRVRLRRLASHDPLTGAENRRTLETALQGVAGAGREPVAVALLDVDHFKRINDTHGHSVGDRVLVEFSALVRHLMRPQDRFFRYGGEEFVLLMPGASREEATGLLRRVNDAARQKIRTQSGPVTLSVGLSMVVAGDTPDSVLARADAALYAAKDAGRDAVYMATSDGLLRA